MKIKILFCIIFLVTESAFSQSIFYVTTVNDSGAGSLRQAMLDANATPAKDQIYFSIPGTPPHTIQVDWYLPDITAPLIIDGSTQPNNGYTGPSPKIVLDGLTMTYPTVGLFVNSDSCEIYGLYIKNMNYFPNNSYAIRLDNGSNCIIGGAGNRKNVLGFGVYGIHINGFVQNLQINNNMIGIDPNGNPAAMTAPGINAHTVMYNVLITNNVISNCGSALWISGVGGADSNVVVKGNKFGTNLSGTGYMGNAAYAMNFTNVRNLQIGDSTLAGRNIFAYELQVYGCSGNIVNNFFNADISGNNPLSVAARLVIDNNNLPLQMLRVGAQQAAEGNLFMGDSSGTGIYAFSIDSLAIINNKFGLNAAGNINHSLLTGIWLIWGSHATIKGNTISANTGIRMDSCDHAYIAMNQFGIDTANALQFTCADAGIYLYYYCSDFLIENNVISNCTGKGIYSTAFNHDGIIRDNILFNNADGIGVDLFSNKTHISHNSIFNNTGKGINLDYLYIHPGNDSLLPPGISYAGSDSAIGASVPFAEIELFYSQSLNSNPQGKDFIASVTADSSGNWKYTGSIMNPGNITATQTDTLNNTSEFSPFPVTAGMNLPAEENKVMIFPNPFSNAAHVFFPNPAHKKFSLKIYDTTGRVCRSNENIFSEKVIIQKEKLFPGIYFFRLLSDNTFVKFTGKLIVQ
ncbi:MAG TPA: right-handed parallel beta-helix repeat-containing protein [Bacteroidia bacterium]|nr:right-handed parallel beta-helix repeat-containing protein [Bacteroidia bacterium]